MRNSRSAVSLIDGHIDEVPTCRICDKPIAEGRNFCKDCANHIITIAEEILDETIEKKKGERND